MPLRIVHRIWPPWPESSVRAFLLANLFLFGIIAIGAGMFWLFGSAVVVLHLSPGFEQPSMIAAAAASLVATYFVGKYLHAFVGSRLNRRR